MLRAAWHCTLAAALGWPAAAALAQSLRAEPPPAIRFSVLPVGGAVESRDNWTPLLDELSRALGRPVSVLSVTSYESLAQALRRDDIDFALLSAKLALDAVAERRMNVVAQVARVDGLPDGRAVLLARRTGPLSSLEELLAHPERWRLARGDRRSVSGFIVPQLRLFLPNGILMETRFESETVDTHQATALAVANGDADVATNNTIDFERFRQQFPAEADRLHVIWQSEPIPAAVFVMRRAQPLALRKKVQDFLVDYGRTKGPRGDGEREVLKSLHAPFGYVAADNTALLAAAELDYQLAKRRALAAKWVNAEARAARLERIERSHAQQVAVLRDGRP